MELYRQGDVLFKRIQTIPSGQRKQRKNGTVAYGEVTGHSHRLANLETASVFEVGDDLFVSVTDAGISIGGATFVHEEHGPITLPTGDYEVTIQREYTPEEIRNVAD